MCDVVIFVMCAMYWVLQFVHWFCHCYVTKSVKNHLFKIIWDITIMAADPRMVEFLWLFSCTNWCILWWHLLYWSFKHTWICSILLRHLLNTVLHISVALSPWIRNVFGLHFDATSIRPQMVISTFCWNDSFCSIWCGGICNASNELSILC